VYWVVDGDERVVEVWTPAGEFPVFERKQLVWSPAGVENPLTIVHANGARSIAAATGTPTRSGTA